MFTLTLICNRLQPLALGRAGSARCCEGSERHSPSLLGTFYRGNWTRSKNGNKLFNQTSKYFLDLQLQIGKADWQRKLQEQMKERKEEGVKNR